MIGMGMGDDRPVDRFQGVDIEVTR
jgi:hypothetical protein